MSKGQSNSKNAISYVHQSVRLSKSLEQSNGLWPYQTYIGDAKTTPNLGFVQHHTNPLFCAAAVLNPQLHLARAARQAQTPVSLVLPPYDTFCQRAALSESAAVRLR